MIFMVLLVNNIQLYDKSSFLYKNDGKEKELKM